MKKVGAVRQEIEEPESIQVLGRVEHFCGTMKSILGSMGVKRKQIVKCFADVDEEERLQLAAILRQHSDDKISFSFHDELSPDAYLAAIFHITRQKIMVKLP